MLYTVCSGLKCVSREDTELLCREKQDFVGLGAIAGQGAAKLAVLRGAFAASGSVQQPLSSLLAPLGNNSVAVTSQASLPHERLLVDEYQQGPDGKYTLTGLATDIYR